MNTPDPGSPMGERPQASRRESLFRTALALLLLAVAAGSIAEPAGTTAAPTEASHLGACRFLLLRQQTPSSLDVAHLKISTNGVSASSYWFSAPKNITVQDFLAVQDEQIRTQLDRQLRTRNLSGSLQLLIDIEQPVHPKDFSRYRRKHGQEAFESLIAAFKRRLDIARELLPDAQIGLYGLPTPTSRELDAPGLADQIAGIQAAADLGLLDSMDVIYPTLYLRYGVDDRDYRSRIISMTRAGIETALTIRRADGTAPGVVPLFSFKIFNGRSRNHREVAPIELARLQLDVARTIDNVSAIAYWTGSDSSELLQWLNELDPVSHSCLESGSTSQKLP